MRWTKDAQNHLMCLEWHRIQRIRFQQEIIGITRTSTEEKQINLPHFFLGLMWRVDFGLFFFLLFSVKVNKTWLAVKSSRHYKAQFQMQTQENENKKPLKKKGKNEN